MTDILKELYNSTYYTDRHPTEEESALRRKEIEFLDRLLPTLGLETIDELTDIQAATAHALNLEWFREGFRLGASLMLELM